MLFLKDWIGYKIKNMRQTPSQWSASSTIGSKSSGTVVDEKAIIVTLANINETKYVLDKLTPNTEYRIQISAFLDDFAVYLSGFNFTEAVKKIKIRNSILKYTIGNLEPGSTYKLQIFAYNPKGDGTRS